MSDIGAWRLPAYCRSLALPMRRVRSLIFDVIREHGITHMCAAGVAYEHPCVAVYEPVTVWPSEGMTFHTDFVGVVRKLISRAPFASGR